MYITILSIVYSMICFYAIVVTFQTSIQILSFQLIFGSFKCQLLKQKFGIIFILTLCNEMLPWIIEIWI